jgi:hypothetical protein
MTSAFDELLDLAGRLGVIVRHARLGGAGGGLAKIRGTRQLFIDLDAGPEDQLEQTLRALAGLEEIDAVFLRPDVRDLLDEARREM